MRTNATGEPGKYQCDHCGKAGPVYTGHPDYEHLCAECRETLANSLKANARPPAGTVLRAARTSVGSGILESVIDAFDFGN